LAQVQVHTRRTRLERQLDAKVMAEVEAASPGDLTIGGDARGRSVAVGPRGRGGAAVVPAAASCSLVRPARSPTSPTAWPPPGC